MKKQSFNLLKNKLLEVFKHLDPLTQEQFVNFAEDLYITSRDSKSPLPEQMSIIDLLPTREKEKCDGCRTLSKVAPCPESNRCDFKCNLCIVCLEFQKHSEACKKALKGEYRKAVQDGEIAVP